MFSISTKKLGSPIVRIGSANSIPTLKTASWSSGNFPDSYGRVSPVRDRLERGSVAHDWIPQDIRTQNKLMRTIYMTDAVIGPALDFYGEVPFGEILVGGIKDEKRVQFYRDALDAIGVQRFIPFLSKNILIEGRLITHLIMDEAKGLWTDLIIHDSDWIKVERQPVLGAEPLIDLIIPPEYKKWATSRDPRILKTKKSINKRLVKMMAAGGTIPLSPENTIFIPRRATANDFNGTGLPFRALPIIAIEYSYISAEVTGLRRRAAPILYATMGTDNWEPTYEEMAGMQDLLIATDEDPVGAKLVLRQGTELNTISGYSEIAKYGEQWSWLKEAKLQSLGMNEAFATGESSWSYLESMLSLGMERVKNFRDFIARELLLQGILAPLARYHNFYKRKESEISHRIRTSSKEDINLDIPTLKWSRSLQPSADRDYMDILTMLEEKGIPVTLRQWAQAGGFDVDESVNGFESDLELRKKIKEYSSKKSKLSPDGGSYGGEEDGGDEEGGEAWASARLANTIANLPLWENGEFGQLRKGEAIELLEKAKINKPIHSEKKWYKLGSKLKERFNLNENKISQLRYLVTRGGGSDVPLPPKVIVEARDQLLKKVNGKVPNRHLMREIYWLNGQLSKQNPENPESLVEKYNSVFSGNELPWLKPADANLLTGVVT